ncbi:hypothetical protein [Bailinhaonella thermotolerans]|uniref:Uncharacterized protein n=1 Tax=Bailinhaonella thermotolerans TaxID=1070861 RepID=A0A3A4AVN0_9ACTN|nr:hypothetical protein [Bailinhaonella thermotolerans]RJL34290.1 hypothetical protein D5H75_07485 [Bailinhaonella thermotolerans]
MTYKHQEPGVDLAVADIVDWLAQRPQVVKDVHAVGDVIVKEVIGALDPPKGSEDWKAHRRRLLDHFWCDLLAALAATLSKVKRWYDDVPDLVARAILECRERERRGPISEALVRLAVKMVWRSLGEMAFAGQIDACVRVLRILAVLICPEPERHPAVLRACLEPLAKETASEVTKERLKQVFPEFAV